jgi:exodeoxyribonuclease VII small subunit
MAKTTTTNGKGHYDEVVTRLEAIVAALEAGELSLEESLERFAEGVTLVKQGESLLGEAEKRIEQLLSEDGRTAPIEVKPASTDLKGGSTVQAPARLAAAPSAAKKPVAAAADDDDVPF